MWETQEIRSLVIRADAPNDELSRWSREFGCSERELSEALRAVGSAPENVSEYLLREPA